MNEITDKKYTTVKEMSDILDVGQTTVKRAIEKLRVLILYYRSFNYYSRGRIRASLKAGRLNPLLQVIQLLLCICWNRINESRWIQS